MVQSTGHWPKDAEKYPSLVANVRALISAIPRWMCLIRPACGRGEAIDLVVQATRMASQDRSNRFAD